jgi:hypothetical protein
MLGIGLDAFRQDRNLEASAETNDRSDWPAPGFEDTKLGVLMEPEVRHGTSEVHAGVQA